MEQPISQTAGSGSAQIGTGNEDDSSHANKQEADKTQTEQFDQEKEVQSASLPDLPKNAGDSTETDTEDPVTDLEQSFIVLDSWTNDNDRDSSRELILGSSSPIRAEMKTGVRQAKNGQYELDLSDKELQNNFVKWLDMLADQNEVSLQQMHLLEIMGTKSEVKILMSNVFFR